MIAGMFVSCNSSSDRKKNSLIYWSSNNTQEIEFAREVVKEWNSDHPNQHVSFQPVPEGQSSEEIILAATVGNTTPDVYSNMWEGDVEPYARANKLIALDTLKGFLQFIYSRCDSSVVKEVTSSDGHIYQVPWKINPIMMMYNENELEQIGFDNSPPTNYQQFLEASDKFQKVMNKGNYVDRWFGYSEVLVTWWQRLFDFYPLYIAASNGAPLIKNNKAAFDNKYAVEVFSFLQTLYKKNYFSRERLGVRQDVFLSGIIGTRFTGDWEIAHAEKFKPKGFKYSFSHLPVPDNHEGPVYTYCDPKNIVIFKTCPNPQLAWDFIKFMLSRKNDLKFLQTTDQLPRRKNLLEDTSFAQYFNSRPKMKIFAEQAKFVKGTDQCKNLTEVFDIISQEYEACVIYGKKTPKQAIDDAAKQVNLLFMN
jgi:multiple sugar transport system substrate-binding protein